VAPPSGPRNSEKSADAFRTIGELSAELGVAQHILRYWETRFPQLRPLQRAGNRRYYRPADVALVRRIADLLNNQGYTVRGVQQLLDAKGAPAPAVPAAPVAPTASAAPAPPPSIAAAAPKEDGIAVDRLVGLRDRLAAALRE
jgi:DNA-binding transcriptional MerR regulator